MASVVQGTNGNYDLPRGLRLYDIGGDLPERARALWALIKDDGIEMAREFWRRYAQSPEVRDPIDAARVEHLAGRILPYIVNKFERIDSPEWTHQAHEYVARALSAGLTLSTLLAGVSAETEAGFVALRHRITDEDEQIRFARTLSDLQALEVDAFIHHAISITRAESEAARGRQAADFNQKVLGVVHIFTRESEQLRAQATSTSSSARGMLARPAKSPPPLNNRRSRCAKPPRPPPD